MRPTTRPGRTTACLAACLVATLLSWTTAIPTGDADDGARRRVTQEGTVRRNGDIEMVHSIRLPLRNYTALKDQVRNSDLLLRQLGVRDQASIFKDAKAEYDDEARSVRLRVVMVGAMKNRGARWHTPVSNAANQEVLDKTERGITLLSVNKIDDGTLETVTTKLTFPEGTRNLHFDAKRGRVVCEMPPPPSDPKGLPDVRADVDVRPEIMSCFHKLYGKPEFSQLWVARAAFENRGKAAATDFRVRFRVANYSEWSPWQKSPLLYPTQTAVEAYYPLFDPKVRDLTSETPSVLQWEWSYHLPDGSLVEESDSQNIALLGMNQVIYSSLPFSEVTSWFEAFDNVPLIGATFVSHTDPVIQRFAGMAAGLAEGAGAAIDDKHAVLYMQAVYDLMVANKIAYQSPPGLFKKGVRQHVKFGRDVLRNRAGTCIDLAVLYASTCQAGGLDAYLVVIPGHAFPAVRLPSGALVPLEATAVSVSPESRNGTFAEAIQRGEATMDEAVASGALYVCDIDEMRVAGVPPPQLPTLPPGALEAWGIKAPTAGTKPTRPTPSQPKRPSGKRFKHPSGLYELTVPAGWSHALTDRGLELSPGTANGAVLITQEKRAHASAQALANTVVPQLVENQKKGSTPLKLTGRAGGTISPTKIPRVTATFVDAETGGKKERSEYHLFVTEKADWIIVMMAQSGTWGQWLEGFREVYRTLTLHDGPPPTGATPPPRNPNEARPQPEPRTPAALPAMSSYRDAAGLFQIPVPRSWKVAPDGAGVSASSPQEDALFNVNVAEREDIDHETFVQRALAIVKQSFPGWKPTASEKFETSGFPTHRAEGTAVYDGAPVVVNCFFVTSKQLHWTLVFASMKTRAAKDGPLLVHVVRGWQLRDPEDLPAPELRAVGREKDAFTLSVPANWRVAYEGEGLVAKTPEGDALAVCRSAAKSFETLDAYAQDVIARMRKRSSKFAIVDQKTLDVDGQTVLMAKIEDTAGDTLWKRGLLATFAGDRQVVFVLSAKADVSFKWRRALDAILESCGTK